MLPPPSCLPMLPQLTVTPMCRRPQTSSPEDSNAAMGYLRQAVKIREQAVRGARVHALVLSRVWCLQGHEHHAPPAPVSFGMLALSSKHCITWHRMVWC